MLWLLHARGAGGRPAAVLLRGLSVVLVVLALAQPQTGSGSGTPAVLAIDRSLSIEETGPEGTIERAWLRAAQSEGCAERCRVLQFGGDPELTTPAEGLLRIQAGGPLSGEQTNLQSALDLAIARAPKGARVVMLSDGQQTAGEASATAARARAREVQIDVVPLAPQRPDLAVTRVQAPRALHAGDPFSLQLTLWSTRPSVAQLSLKLDGKSAGKPISVRLQAGETAEALPEIAPAEPGSHVYEVAISLPRQGVSAIEPQRMQNNALATTVQVGSPPQVLVAGSDASSFAGLLEAGGVESTVVEPQSLPSIGSEYARYKYDAVLLSDVSASELGDARAEALREAVEEGSIGLLALGGPNSFSLGHYYESPLQELLPVRSLVPGNVKGAIALELVLDHSESMIDLAGEYPKIEMAQKASRVAAEALTKHQDEFGIVAFNIKPATLLPLRKIMKGARLHHDDARISQLQPEGGTNIYKGLAAGVKEIEKSKAPDRHIVLMTDGVSEEAGSYKQLLPTLLKDHITVSTIALGDEADTTLLETIAHETHGEYFRVNEAGVLPRIFAKQTRLSARPVVLTGKLPVHAGEASPVLDSLQEQGPLAPVQGSVATALKEGAQADLLTEDRYAEHKTDPALAQWQYGVGRVLTWTPGLSSEWAPEWADNGPFWQGAVRWVERGVGVPLLTPALAAGDQEELEVDTVRNAGEELEYSHLTGTLARAHGHAQALHFTQSAPSRYVAALPAHAEGVYRYTVSDGVETAEGLLAVPYPAEYKPGQSDRTELGPLAAATGGQVLSPNAESSIESNWTSLWPWFVLAALLCFLADVALRMLGGKGRPKGSAPTEPPAQPDAQPRTEDRALARS